MCPQTPGTQRPYLEDSSPPTRTPSTERQAIFSSDWVLIMPPPPVMAYHTKPEVLVLWADMHRCELWCQHLDREVTSRPD